VKEKKKHKNHAQTVLTAPAVSNNKYLGLSFIFPAAILGTVFALNGVYPFGSRQILVNDFSQQLYPFLDGFWHKLREGAVSPWSWNAGLGHDYVALITYYLASPLNLLTIILPHAALREALTVILLVKIGCAGLFTSMYLRYAYKMPPPGKDQAWLQAQPVFSSLYALCGFTLGYYHNIIWFDSFALFPLVMLGILALMREGKFRLYIVSLALAVLLNFYIGYIICVFAVIMFFGWCAVHKLSLSDFLRKLRLILACSALAAAMTAVLTVPAWFALQDVFSAQTSSPGMAFYTSFFDIFGNFIAFIPPTVLGGLPNLYSGLISVLLAGLFIQSKKITLREKIAFIIIFVFLLISTNIDILSFFMHGFHYPVGYPARFSFLISFILVVTAYRAFFLTEEMGRSGLAATGISASLFLLSSVLGPQERNSIIGSVILCALYISLFYFSMITRAVKTRTFARTALFITILTELSIASYIGVKTVKTSDREEYFKRYEQIKALLNARKKTGVDFYRTELFPEYNANAPYFFNYNGVSFFSSIVNPDVMRFMRGLGLNASRAQYISTSCYYIETSPLTNAFLNMRYIVGIADSIDDKDVYWGMVGKHGDMLLLENKYYLPLGFMVDNRLADYRFDDDPFAAQNNFFRLATGLDGDLFKTFRFEISDMVNTDDKLHLVKWDYQFQLAGMAYAYCLIEDLVPYQQLSFRPQYKTYLMEMYLNGEKIKPSQFVISSNTPYVFTVGNITEGDNITFQLQIKSKALICVGFLNSELFEQGYAKLAGQTLRLTEFTNTKVKGKITTLEDGLLYTSIPADKNWNVYVDGVKREIVKIDNAMIAVSLNKGDHEIEFSYFNKSFLAGSIVSLVALALFIVLAMLEKRKHRSGNT